MLLPENNINRIMANQLKDIPSIVETYKEPQHICQCIIPPHMTKKIAENHPSPERRAIAANKLHLDFRLQRTKKTQPKPAATQRIRIYNANNTQALPGSPIPFSATYPDVEENEAYKWSVATDTFYKTKMNRNSIDDKGMTIIATVHYDQNLDNAFWQGTELAIGDGDKPGPNQVFNRFTIDPDVIGHEFGHGVTQYAADKGEGLDYHDQSGALNEHWSDVSGIQVKMLLEDTQSPDGNWKIGEHIIVGDNYSLRNMLKPGTAYKNHPVLGDDPQPDHMANYQKLPNNEDGDYGGVHINNSIPNRAFATACVEQKGYPWDTIGKIWYSAYPNIKHDAQFLDMANVTVDLAQKLFGVDSQPHKSVVLGWRTVGVLK